MNTVQDRVLINYCTGCGLCEAVGIGKLSENSKGFFFPTEGDETQLRKICPSMRRDCSQFDPNEIWGKNVGIYLGWSNNQEVRKSGSSGGLLTEIALFLLESGLVDCIIHCGASSENPSKTTVSFSWNRQDIMKKAGSRYAISSPLKIIDQINKELKYAFIGRPCDIAVLRNYMAVNKSIEKSIPYLLSFFCMGVPSAQAQKNLLDALDCQDCVELTYRGNGWPGKTTAIGKDGSQHSMEYSQSWGKILGRDLMPYCRFCVDGIGESADIACGDAWYVLPDGSPDFSEHDGRNVVFPRNKKGLTILQKMAAKKLISFFPYDNSEAELKKIQKSQMERRKNLEPRLYAMRLFGRPTPKYPASLLRSYAKMGSYKEWIRAFAGTAKRIVQNKL